MARCWNENSEERPSFEELAAELDRALTIMVGYMEVHMELQVAITEDELGKRLQTLLRDVAIDTITRFCDCYTS